MLGDFINQSLTINHNVIEENLLELKDHATRWLMDENCRNYRQIGEEVLTPDEN